MPPRPRRTLKQFRNELVKIQTSVASILVEIDALIQAAKSEKGTADGGNVRPVVGGSCPPPK